MGNDEVDLWATDEVHFQQHGSRCRMWVPPETKDPVLLHHPTRHSIGYFGAVRLRDGKFRFVRETGKFNAMSFFAFIRYCGWRVSGPGAVLWSLPTTPDTTTPGCTKNGVRATSRISDWNICHPTVPN